MSRPVINPGTLIWSGEYWINYLREPRSDSDSGMVGLYHTRYCAAGEENVAFVDVPGEGGFCGVCTNNREVAAFVVETMIRGKGSPFDRDLPVLDARISRRGDVRSRPSWIIQAGGHLIAATWGGIQPPVVAEGWSPTFREGIDFFTLIFFCDEASIRLDGRSAPGRPYLRDIWKKSIGGDRSSCVFALAETMIGAPEL